MAKTSTAAEPSMEEILASIRRIIADEEPSPPSKAAAEPPSTAPQPAPQTPDEDVLDLQMTEAEAESLKVQPTDFDDIGFAVAEEAPPAPEPPALRVASPPPRTEPAAPEPPRLVPEPAPSRAAADPLLSAQATESVSSAFGALSHAIFSREARTVEDLTKELLRPMLQRWLDDNLPTLVERLVREEIERVARGRR